MATTPASAHHQLFNHHPAAAVTTPPPVSDHLNMLSLRDVVFISPPPTLHHQPPHQPATGVGLGVSIFPILPCLPSTTTNIPVAATALDFQVHPQFQANRLHDDNAASNLWSFSRKDAFSYNHQDDADQSLGGRGAMLRVCRDCGNRAKKECVHRRCRTCCKSHGYDCPTHEKSTWVPASKRRERQQLGSSRSHCQGPSQDQGFATGISSSFSSGVVKRPRLDNNSAAAIGSSASNVANPRSFDTITCPQDASFKRSLPGKVEALAVFKCIRVTAISDNAAELVYQAKVTISGHVFKGFLYDQGMDRGKNLMHRVSELHFKEVDGGVRDGADDSSPVVMEPTFIASGCRRLPEEDVLFPRNLTSYAKSTNPNRSGKRRIPISNLCDDQKTS